MKVKDIHLQQIKEKGIDLAVVQEQIDRFEAGFPKVVLDRPAKVGDGILHLDQAQNQSYVDLFDKHKEGLALLKFVPASGAATRMFKFLYEFNATFDSSRESINSYINNNKANDLFTFLVGMEKFPFMGFVLERLRSMHHDFDQWTKDRRSQAIIGQIINEDELGYVNLPKGLVPFHTYKDHEATAFEEHLFEAVLYTQVNKTVKIHFTINPKHQVLFDKEYERILPHVKKKTGVDFEVSFSYQKPSTDTIAVDEDNTPFLLDDGSWLFRPAGHGALLENLNQLDADLIFIKNVDNVTTSMLEQQVSDYKKVLGGFAIEIKSTIDKYLTLLKNSQVEDLSPIESFIKQRLNGMFPHDYNKYTREYQIQYLVEILDRPLRVCGMVKNEGEPGGGPFWVRKSPTRQDLQIIEMAQVNQKQKQQRKIAKAGTHFNPVDIVCCVRDYKGDKYDLLQYRDAELGFITNKTNLGKKLKALELPGLWNGSMAFWNTVFIEVPLMTFNPVKTVNDLLKPAHQPS